MENNNSLQTVTQLLGEILEELKTNNRKANSYVPLGVSKKEIANAIQEHIQRRLYEPVTSIPEHLYIGDDTSGHPMFINMKNSPHMLLSGHCRSGKSRSLQVMLTNLLMNSTDKNINIHILQPTKCDLALFRRFPQVKSIPNSISEIFSTIQRLEIEFNERMDFIHSYIEDGECSTISEYNNDISHDTKFPIIYVVVDELQELMNFEFDDDHTRIFKKTILSKLAKFTQFGNALGIYLLATTSRPVKELFPPYLLANICNKLQFDDNEDATMEFCGNTERVITPKADDKDLFSMLKNQYLK